MAHSQTPVYKGILFKSSDDDDRIDAKHSKLIVQDAIHLVNILGIIDHEVVEAQSASKSSALIVG